MTAWAYAADAVAPVSQDWDIIATSPDLASLFLALAADRKCPQRRFFLGCLYLLAGDAVRTGFRTLPQQRLTELTTEAETIGEAWVRTWARRTRALIATPASFSYDAWCDSRGLARTPV
jgi:hypothetical protein